MRSWKAALVRNKKNGTSEKGRCASSGDRTEAYFALTMEELPRLE